MHKFVVSLLLTAASVQPLHAEVNLDDLDKMAGIADKICTKVEQQGGSKSIQLEGKGNADVSFIVKSLIDAGVEGAVKYENNEYKSVLQEDLSSVMIKNINCREKMLDIFIKRMSNITSDEQRKIKYENTMVFSIDEFYLEKKNKMIYADITIQNVSLEEVYVQFLLFDSVIALSKIVDKPGLDVDGIDTCRLSTNVVEGCKRRAKIEDFTLIKPKQPYTFRVTGRFVSSVEAERGNINFSILAGSTQKNFEKIKVSFSNVAVEM